MSIRSTEMFPDAFIAEMLESEFCRVCGGTVSWTSEDWVHDVRPFDDHEPSVPGDPYDDL